MEVKMNTAGVILIFFGYFICIYAENIPGVVQLNTGTFDKIISRFDAVLVKYDETYPYGDAQDAFKEVVKDTLSQDRVLMTEVHIADYGEKENQELADRYGLTKDDFPAYKLFIKGKNEPVSYTGDVKNSEQLRRFLMKESGLWLGLPACIEEFDGMVKEFFTKASDRQNILQQARSALEKRTDENEKERGEIYVKYMEKVIEKGDNFIPSELERVEKLSGSKVSEKKKEQLKDRANILTSFSLRLKDEL